MKKLVILVITSLFIGAAAGYTVAEIQKDDSASSGHAADMHDDTAHEPHTGGDHMAHETFEVDPENAPTVDFTVTEDAKSGWNVRVDTTNFEFTPGSVNADNVAGEGHAHLYVDGQKVARLYGPDFHYGETFDGTKTFRVTLNANDHSEYAVDGEVIEATQKVTHQAHD